jgi:peptidoglycan/xylan/chitin deacetylase (PgdA/CDA1 family)
MSLALKHFGSRILHAYADFKIGATKAEKRCYKNTDSILLTFDDYGTKQEVTDILQILRQKQVKAMFFLQGDWAEQNADLVLAIKKEGHIVGNHTVTHAILKDVPQQKVISEISGGLPGPWLRPPQGRYNKRVRAIAAKLGYAICYWTIDSRDWTNATVPEIRHTILTELHPGAVILFHLHAANTRQMLPGLIDDIRAKGYQLTAPSENWDAPITRVAQ